MFLWVLTAARLRAISRDAGCGHTPRRAAAAANWASFCLMFDLFLTCLAKVYWVISGVILTPSKLLSFFFNLKAAKFSFGRSIPILVTLLNGALRIRKSIKSQEVKIALLVRFFRKVRCVIVATSVHVQSDVWMWTRREVCKDHSRWYSVVFAYPHGKKAWGTYMHEYVCIYIANLLFGESSGGNDLVGTNKKIDFSCHL